MSANRVESYEETRRNNEVDREVREAKTLDKKVKKILFLGSGGSGKSTIFKQLRNIYGDVLSPQERRNYVTYIHEQCINQMKHALEVLKDYHEGSDIMHENHRQYIHEEKDTECDDHDIPDLSSSGLEAADFIQGLHHSQHRLNDEIVAYLKTLWDEPAIRKMYEMRNITNIEDSSSYFWNILDTINDPNWLPDEADYLLVRHRTTGVTEKEYEIQSKDGGNKSTFKIVDVGGQRSERKKWIKCFDSVTAVIFVASLSCYDEVLFEDYNVNTMTDQLQLFDDVINNPSLQNTSMILFLNKKDLFAEKIKRVSLSKCKSFATYRDEPHSFDQTTRYIRKAFTSLNKTPQKRNIFTHITCATDRQNINKVFADVQHIVIESSLIQAGLMDYEDERKYPNNEVDDADPETAAVIRETIQNQQSNRKDHTPHSGGYGGSKVGGYHLTSLSMNNFDFRERIKRDSIPHIRSIEYLSVLPQYEYSDDRNVARFTNAESLMTGKYCWAISTVPPNIFTAKSSIAGNSASSNEEKEMYLMVDMAPDPITAGQNVQRRRINLAVVLDVGQSMNKHFTDMQQKLEQSKRVIVDILKNELDDNDRFCLVLFDDIAKVFQSMVEVGKRNITELSHMILEGIKPQPHSLPSTRVDHAGYDLAVQEFRKLEDREKEALNDCENRVIVISAMPLSGQTIDNMTTAATADEAIKRVYSTFICNRHDRDRGLNWDEIQKQRERVYQIAGCNYFTINSSEQLKDRLVARFEETVTPLMFDLSVTVEVPSSDNGECVYTIYRLNEETKLEDIKSGLSRPKNEILSIRTLFPYQKPWDEETTNFRYNYRNHHYLLLVKLKMKDVGQRELQIVQRYQDPNGETVTVRSTLALEMSRELKQLEFQDAESSKPLISESESPRNEEEDYYDNMSIRKAILLLRYIRVLREWVQNDNRKQTTASGVGGMLRTSSKGRSASSSIVSSEFQSRFQLFTAYFQSESRLIDDDELARDLNVLKHLFNRKQ